MIIEQLTPNVFVCSTVLEDGATVYKTTELFRHHTDPVHLDITEYVYKQQLLATVRSNVEHLLSTEAIQHRIQLRVDNRAEPLTVAVRPTTAVFVANVGGAYPISIKDGEKTLEILVENNSAVFVREADRVAVGVNSDTVRKSIYIDWILTAQ
jgi:hypothetical protein